MRYVGPIGALGEAGASAARTRRAHGRNARFLGVAIACLLGLAVAAAPAGATLRLANTLSVVNPQAVAVDQASGDVYVVGADSEGALTLKRFDSAGAPDPFTAVAPYVAGNELTGTAGGPFSFDSSGSAIEVAIDNSGGLNDGNVYVTESGAGAVDVFAASGEYLGHITEAGGAGFGEPCGVAIDPSGDVYVGDFGGNVDRYVPTANPPTNADYAGQISGVAEPCAVAADATGAVYAAHWPGGPLNKYAAADFGTSNPGVLVDELSTAVAVDPASEDVYVDEGEQVAQFSSGGTALATIGAGELSTTSTAIAVSGAAGNLYLGEHGADKVKVFAPQPTVDPVTVFGAHTATFGGSAVSGGFGVSYHFEYSTDGITWTKVPVPDAEAAAAPGSVPVDQEVEGLTGSQLYHVRLVAGRPEAGGGGVASEETTFTTLASAPKVSGTEASPVTATEATLKATVNPENEATAYHFEYVDDADFQATGYANATRVPSTDADAGEGGAPVSVSRSVTGLAPATKYHFRLIATNHTGVTTGEEGADRTFATFPAPQAGLPDSRGYELVSPADSNGQSPVGKITGLQAVPFAGVFNYSLVSGKAGAATSAMFYVLSGSLPGLGGAGTSDRYEAVRGEGGWTTHYVGQSGAQAEYPAVGSASPDLGYYFVAAQQAIDRGTFKSPDCDPCTFLHEPDGDFSQVGEGDLTTDPGANGRLITEGGTHVIFTSADQLESNAPTGDLETVYDRTPEGLKVVSLLPGDVTPATESVYRGASEDGSAVAFTNGTTLYLRRNDSETLTIAGEEPAFAGISRNGSRVFFLEEPSTVDQVTRGKLFTCDADEGSCEGIGAHAPIPIGSGNESAVVNVSADGSHVYFTSPEVLTAGEKNDNGEEATGGGENLYVWSGSGIRYVATVTEADMVGTGTTGIRFDGLGLWTANVLRTESVLFGVANDPSRTTPSGEVLVFQSHANLSSYDSHGHSEVYRYDTADPASLRCISCSPSEAAAVSDASLEDPTGLETESPVLSRVEIANVTEDEEEVFFETGDPLVPGDNNGVGDVYEWEAEGSGGCAAAKGCVSLISSGHSARRSYLYAMTPDGHDVLFWTAGALVPQDHNQGVPTIYDARVGGGFPPPASESPPCQGDACQGQATPSPTLATPASTAGGGAGNVKPHRHHRAHKKKHRKHGRHVRGHRRAGSERRAGR